jgi:hypothetical protein
MTDTMNHQLHTIVEQLVSLGSSEEELRMWEAVLPIMTDEEKTALLENLNKELEILQTSKNA